MQHFDSAGVDIAYLDTGEEAEKTPILLIHGFASNIATNWVSTGWVDVLKRTGHRVVAVDNRGHGASQKLYEQADYGAPIMAEDVRRLLDHLSIPQAHVMGFSMGARISAFLALAHPARVKSVVFGGLGINMIRGLAGTGPIARALEADSLEDVTNPTARTFRAFAEQTQSDLKALAACIRSSRAPISADMISRIRAPALVAVGSDDVVGGSAEELAALIPGAKAFTIEGRDHMKSVGDKSYKNAVVQFLADVEAGRA
ncbi:MAG TPA: alpha/beta hydrolase [Hyphomicrobium sp.]|nr:alpha/beta hydrolase [Hyphomicrobium sp.]